MQYHLLSLRDVTVTGEISTPARTARRFYAETAHRPRKGVYVWQDRSNVSQDAASRQNMQQVVIRDFRDRSAILRHPKVRPAIAKPLVNLLFGHIAKRQKPPRVLPARQSAVQLNTPAVTVTTPKAPETASGMMKRCWPTM